MTQPRYTLQLILKNKPETGNGFVYHSVDNPDLPAWVSEATGSDDKDVYFFNEDQINSMLSGQLSILGTEDTRINDYNYRVYRWTETEVDQNMINDIKQKALLENAMSKLSPEEVEVLKKAWKA